MKLNYYKPIISAVIATTPFISGQTACPDPWVVNTVYVEGDQVGAKGNIYQCNAWPFDGHCGQAGFEPGDNPFGLSNPYWEIAWTLMGTCDAPITPIPHFDPNVQYDYGDMVINKGKVWQCNAPWPYTPRCSQAGYSPGVDHDEKSLYLEAWEEIVQGPSVSPSVSKFPSALPSLSPSAAPSNAPSTSLFPTAWPSMIPSASPSSMPSLSPSAMPSSYPSAAPSNTPSTTPSVSPSYKPSSSPSEKPSLTPSAAPSNTPSTTPSVSPSYKPSSSPSEKPSLTPSAAPSNAPSASPSTMPSLSPSTVPTSYPSAPPSDVPSASPSTKPSLSSVPSTSPSNQPSLCPNPPSPPTSFARYWLACGRSDSTDAFVTGCMGQSREASTAESHEVRCCKDCPSANPGDGWLQDDRNSDTCSASVWGKSKDSNGNCQHALNYNQAVAMCADTGGRLCTKEELLADCTAYTGCGHDFDFVWSSTGVREGYSESHPIQDFASWYSTIPPSGNYWVKPTGYSGAAEQVAIDVGGSGTYSGITDDTGVWVRVRYASSYYSRSAPWANQSGKLDPASSSTTAYSGDFAFEQSNSFIQALLDSSSETRQVFESWGRGSAGWTHGQGYMESKGFDGVNYTRWNGSRNIVGKDYARVSGMSHSTVSINGPYANPTAQGTDDTDTNDDTWRYGRFYFRYTGGSDTAPLPIKGIWNADVDASNEVRYFPFRDAAGGWTGEGESDIYIKIEI